MSVVDSVLQAIGVGSLVVLHDERTDEGNLVGAAALARTSSVAFMVRHSGGFVMGALPPETCERLDLPRMSGVAAEEFRVTVDAVGTGTGISAAARATTLSALADPESNRRSFTRPGHVVPVCAYADGVLARQRPAEAAMDLARLAGLPAAGVLSTVVSSDCPSDVARERELRRFANEHGLPFLSIGDLVRHRAGTESQVRRLPDHSASAGPFRMVRYQGLYDDSEHIAFVLGDPALSGAPVHLHVECVVGAVVSPETCGCRAALDRALSEIEEFGAGVLVYARPQRLPLACRSGSVAEDTDLRVVTDWILADLGVPGAVCLSSPAPVPGCRGIG